MLKSFRIGNFRNLVNVEFRPVGRNLLVGPNNAGKTNLCAALRFLSLSARLDLASAVQQAVGETWNLSNVYVTSPILEFELSATILDGEESVDFEYVLKVRVDKTASQPRATPSVVSEELRANVSGNSHCLIRPRPQTILGSDATQLSRAFDTGPRERTALFKQYLQSWAYYSLDPSALRSPFSTEKPALLPDGTGLSRVLFALHNEQPRVEKKIIAALRAIEPKADVFVYQSPDPQSVFVSMEDQEGHRFGMHSFSDGTLRYLAIAHIIHSVAESMATKGYAPLIIIEEPANGLYVGQLKPLMEKIDPSGNSGQFIFTSHSPYFIDLFEKDLKGVHVLKPGKPSAVLTVPDEQKVGKLLEEMPLGELHFREMLT